MNALYLVLIGLGFAAGVVISSIDSSYENVPCNYADELRCEPEDEDLNFEAETEVKSFKLFN